MDENLANLIRDLRSKKPESHDSYDLLERKAGAWIRAHFESDSEVSSQFDQACRLPEQILDSPADLRARRAKRMANVLEAAFDEFELNQRRRLAASPVSDTTQPESQRAEPPHRMFRHVFVSKPNALTTPQEKFWNRLRPRLEQRGLHPRTIGTTDFPNKAPLTAVAEIMQQCEGAIVLGFRQIEIVAGTERGGTSRERKLKGHVVPTAWNHIEAAMAFAYRLPLLLIKEQGIEGAVFDIGSSDRFIHQASLEPTWLDSPNLLQPFNDWHDEIVSKRRW